ncbi:MAG: DUF5676 family membrane protein [Pirellulaceae bacterium]
MNMKLDVRAAALAAGSIAALVYVLCTVFCALVPESTVVYLGTVFLRVDLTGLYRQVTWGSFVAGLLGYGLGPAVMAGAMAWLYNRLARMEDERSLSASERDFAAAGRAP